MDVAKREMAECEQQPAGQLIPDAAHDRVCGRAVGALEVPEHDQLELGPVGSVHVVLGGEGSGELGHQAQARS
jgi:hypothetical protein